MSLHGRSLKLAMGRNSEALDLAISGGRYRWRQSSRYPEEIAEHIGYNLIVNRQRLSNLDGWADQPDCRARVIKWPYLEQDMVIVAAEIDYEKT